MTPTSRIDLVKRWTKQFIAHDDWREVQGDAKRDFRIELMCDGRWIHVASCSPSKDWDFLVLEVDGNYETWIPESIHAIRLVHVD